MNGPDLSSVATPELVSVTGIGGPSWPSPRPDDAPEPAPAKDTPDAEIAIADTLVRVHAMFHVDPETKRVQVSVVDEQGRLIRMIPPESVSEMLAAMSAYPTRP